MTYGTTIRRGFTLVEILMVVVILGIAAAVIVPQIGTRGDLKAASAARVMMADLIYAQNRAITQQATTYVSFDTSTNTYSVLSSPSPVTYVTNPVTMSNYIQRFGAGGTHGFEDVFMPTVTLNGSTTQTILTFDDLGTPGVFDSSLGTVTPLTQAGTIRITSGAYGLTVNVQPDTGEIEVQ